MFSSKNQHASLWDKKAKQYHRFSHDPTSFQCHILSKIAHRDISFKDKKILDIGCGTGIYTLHIAKEASHVNALDFSKEMLDILSVDAKAEGLFSKFDFTCNTWDGFKSDEPFDIVFSSMSPALQKEDDFAKMHELAKEYCIHLGWGGKRESTLLDPLFTAHGKTLKAPFASEPLKRWLKRENIAYVSEYIDEKRLNEKPYQEAYESVLWHFEIDEIKPDIPLIESILHAMQNEGGNIVFETNITVELISWSK